LPSLDVIDHPSDYFDEYEHIEPAQMEVLKGQLMKEDEMHGNEALTTKLDAKRVGVYWQDWDQFEEQRHRLSTSRE
jgi:hypothetical protein